VNDIYVTIRCRSDRSDGGDASGLESGTPPYARKEILNRENQLAETLAGVSVGPYVGLSWTGKLVRRRRTRAEVAIPTNGEGGPDGSGGSNVDEEGRQNARERSGFGRRGNGQRGTGTDVAIRAERGRPPGRASARTGGRNDERWVAMPSGRRCGTRRP